MVGILTMGVIVPAIFYFLIPLKSLSQVVSIALILMSGWGVADFAANILARPRLQTRRERPADGEAADTERDSRG